MTIKVEREALLRVIERPSTVNSTSSLSNDYLLVDYCNLISTPATTDDVEKLRHPTEAPSSDEDSIFTLSTASFSDSEDEEEEPSLERRVRFAEQLVSDEWTRPYTLKSDLPQLFYTTEETQRFRQEYRMERKLLSELSIDPDTFPVDDNEELSALVATSCSQPPTGRHSISRVVVLHNDKLETFFTPPQASGSDDFFDNDSFWSGSITWY